jgi:hypothetical protein
MRRMITRFPIVLGLLTAVLVTAGPASGQETPPQEAAPGETEAEAPITKTEVVGDVDLDLRGVWLLLTHGQIANSDGKVRNGADIYVVSGSGGDLTFELYLHELPPDMGDAVKAANKTLTPWTPSDQQLAALSRDLDSLPPIDPTRFVKHTVRVVAPFNFATAFKGDVSDIVGDSQFALEIDHEYRPRPPKDQMAQLMLDKAILGAKQKSPTLYEGKQARTLLAAGFAPIPVTMRGPFWLYRLRGPEGMPAPQSTASGSWLARFWSSLTRGCR